MLAAVKCDYDRLNELREARSELIEEFNSNPENAGVDFDNWARNQHMLTSEDCDELAELEKSKAKKYRSYADKILENLQNEKYRTNQSPFFLQHSVGGKPNKVEIDVPIIYADYYYVEALKRKLSYKR